MPRTVIASVLLFCALVLGLNAQDPAVERGQKQFVQSCGFCHGPDATGGRGPDLIRSQLVNNDKAGAQIAQVIKAGRPEKGMPAFASLNDAQISDIIAFLRYRIEHQSEYPGEDYPLERLLVGDAQAGRAYFYGAGKCATCHSPTGDLAGVAARHKPVDLQQQMLMPASGPARSAIVHLKNGQSVEGRLEALDEFRVAVRDAQGWYRSYPRDQVEVEIKDPRQAHRDLLNKLSDTDIHNLFAYLETLK